MSKLIKTIVIDKNKNDIRSLLKQLQKYGYDVENKIIQDLELLPVKIKEFKPDIIFADYSLPDKAAANVLLQKHSLEIPVIVLSRLPEKGIIKSCLENGAWDFILKEKYEHLEITLKNALTVKTERLKRQISQEKIIDSNGYFNIAPTSEKILVRPSQEFAGRHLSEVFPQGLADKTLAAIKKTLKLRQMQKVVYLLDISGEKRWFEARLTPKTNSSVLFVAIDITDMKKYEEESRKTAVRYQELFNNMIEGVAILEACADGSDFILKDYNLASSRINRWKRDQVIGSKITQVFPIAEDKGLIKNLKKVYETGKTLESFINKIEDKKIIFWINYHIYKLPTNELVVIYKDTTKFKKTEKLNEIISRINKKAVESENLDEFAEAVNSSLSELMSTENFYIAIYNQKLEKYNFLLHVDKFDKLKKNEYYSLQYSCTDYVRKKGNSELVDKKREKELFSKNEIKLIGKSSKVWIGAPIKNPKTNAILGVIALQSYDDPDCYKKDDLKTLEFIAGNIGNIIQKKTAVQSLKKSNERLSLITKILRHDLTNDLVAINSACRLYKSQNNEEYLAEIQKKVDHGIDLIRQMRDQEIFLRENKELSIINLKSVLAKICDQFSFVKIDIRGSGNVFADSSIDSVFSNIINNAIRHGAATKIEIDISHSNSNCILKITNNGRKIDEAVKANVFQKGFKAGETGNSGLGLYIVKNLMQFYKGCIYLETEPQTTFLLSFKRAIT